MYQGSHFIESDPQLIAELIAAYPFATLVSVDAAQQPIISHLPVIADGHGGLLCHLATAHPHTALLGGDAETLVIFQGPHAYISPTWYAQPGVPTWNYAAVHIRARVAVLQADAAQQLLDQLIGEFDEPSQAGHLSQEQRAHLLAHIHCIALTPLKIEASFKLSQNRTPSEQQNIISQLSQQDSDNANGIAALMLHKLRNHGH